MGARVDLLTTIAADDDLLPALLTPGLAAIALAFFITSCIVLVKKLSTSLYMIMTMNSSIR